MLAPFRDPTYRRRNRITALLLVGIPVVIVVTVVAFLGVGLAFGVACLVAAAAIFGPFIAHAWTPVVGNPFTFTHRTGDELIAQQTRRRSHRKP